MNVLIIEDEPKTARDLAYMITRVKPAAQIIKVLETVKDSVDFLSTAPPPDVIFSDIQLADGSCFEIFRHVDIDCPIVFCTAYDEYAFEAFKTNGIDYITKPFSDREIAHALAKLEQLQKHFEKTHLNKLVSTLLQQKPYIRQSFLVSIRDRFIPVNVKDIALFNLEHEIVYLYLPDGKKYAINLTLDEIERSVDTQLFFRANRQCLISRTTIQEATQYFGRKLMITPRVKCADEIIVSRAKASAFLEWLGQ